MTFFSRLYRDNLRACENRTEPSAIALFSGAPLFLALVTAIGLAQPAAVVLAAAFGGAALMAGSAAVAGYILAARKGYTMSENRVIDKDISYAGSTRDLGMVVNSLRSIRSLTKDFGTAAKLPEKLQRRVASFIEDMKPAALKVTAFRGDQQLDSIPVSRTVVGPDGVDVEHVLASVPAGKSPLSPHRPA